MPLCNIYYRLLKEFCRPGLPVIFRGLARSMVISETANTSEHCGVAACTLPIRPSSTLETRSAPEPITAPEALAFSRQQDLQLMGHAISAEGRGIVVDSDRMASAPLSGRGDSPKMDPSSGSTEVPFVGKQPLGTRRLGMGPSPPDAVQGARDVMASHAVLGARWSRAFQEETGESPPSAPVHPSFR